MRKPHWMLWQGLVTPSLERCTLTPVDGGFELNGLILQSHQETPYVVRYGIQVDSTWKTRRVDVELDNGGRHTLVLNRDRSGRWSRDGEPLHGFDSCADVDLEWSPSTNTLPIRRLDLRVGQAAELAATWIRFPSLDVERLDQSYERVAEDQYRYRSGGFMADISVDSSGLVLRYGVIWKAVASSGDRVLAPS